MAPMVPGIGPWRTCFAGPRGAGGGAMSRDAFDRLAAGWNAASGPGSPLAADFRANLECLEELCRGYGGARVLDIGCATGLHLIHLAPHIAEGVGIDFAPAMIAAARAGAAGLANLRFAVADALENGPPGRFDLVLLVGVVEHLADPAAALGRAARRLDAGGRVVVITPHRANPLFLWKRLRGRRATCFDGDRLYGVADLARLARRAGLAVEAVRPLPFSMHRPADPAPAPVRWAARLAALVPAAPTRGAFAMVLAPGAPGSG